MTGGFSTRLAAIHARIAEAAARAGRDPGAITLLAVSKTFPAERVREAVAQGIMLFGESRVQEALPKMDDVGPGAAWHLIGHLQKNKVAKAVGRFALIHSVDSIELARRMDRLAGEAGVRQPVLVQVNVSREAQKHGFPPERTAAVVAELSALPHLEIKGLMGMAPKGDGPESARPAFADLKALFDAIAQDAPKGVTMETLSMGMSGDFEIAIEEGATLVRVGGALFGERE